MAYPTNTETINYVETSCEPETERKEYPHEALNSAICRFDGVIGSMERLITKISGPEPIQPTTERVDDNGSLHSVLSGSAERLSSIQEKLYQKIDEIEKLLFS